MLQASDLITRVRGKAEDWGHTLTDTFVLTANDPSGTVYQLSQNPIASTPLPTLSDAGVSKTYGTHFTVDFNRSELTVLYTQTLGNTLTAVYTSMLYRDERILTGVADGIRRMYPYVYKIGELYISLQVQQWEYDLTNTTAVPDASTFPANTCSADYVAAIARADIVKPQTRIHSAEFLMVGGAGTMPWRPFANFRRNGAHNLLTDSYFNAGDVLKLVYSAPCTPPETTNDFIDVPDPYIDLPVWYALGTLLGGKESVRDRSDSYQTQNTFNANPVNTQWSTGNNYMNLFWTTLRANPMRPMRTEIRKTLPNWARNWP